MTDHDRWDVVDRVYVPDRVIDQVAPVMMRRRLAGAGHDVSPAGLMVEDGVMRRDVLGPRRLDAGVEGVRVFLAAYGAS